MLLRRITDYLLRHRFQALAWTFLITFLPVFRVFGIVTAAFMTLVKGARIGFYYTLAVLLSLSLGFALLAIDQTQVPEALLVVVGAFVLLANVLTWILAMMLRRQASWATLMQVSVLGGALLISILHIAYPGIADWWFAWASKLQAAAKMDVNPNQIMEVLNDNKYYGTGILMTMVFFAALSQLVIARWWQAALYAPGSLRRELQGIRLRLLAVLLFGASVVLAYLGNGVVLDIMPLLYSLFFMAGLSVVHYLFREMQFGTRLIWLTLFYVALVLTLPMSAVLVVCVAVLDSVFDLRKRFSKT